MSQESQDKTICAATKLLIERLRARFSQFDDGKSNDWLYTDAGNGWLLMDNRNCFDKIFLVSKATCRQVSFAYDAPYHSYLRAVYQAKVHALNHSPYNGRPVHTRPAVAVTIGDADEASMVPSAP